MFLPLLVLGLAQTDLPNPFTLKKEELEKGNPLAQYAEMLRLEKDYLKDVSLLDAFNGKGLAAGMASTYCQARATIEGNLGDIQASLRTQNVGWFHSTQESAYTKNPFSGMKPTNAVSYIAAQAPKFPWIMIGEEHMKPQTRCILLPLLRALKKQGFTYFAAETFNDAVAETTKNGYPTWKTGYYSDDPVFADGIREAIRLGYKLIPYEAREQPKDVPPGDPWFAQNFREHLQAENLKKRIYDLDPKAKVLVWAGRSHVIKVSSKQDNSEFRPMGYEFKRMTGIDPLSVYLPTETEAGLRDFETPEYKYATSRGLVKGPTVFVNHAGEAWGVDGDLINVFFPQTTYPLGRPDWLARDLKRVPHAIPAGMVGMKGLLLAQVWLEGEPDTAVPVDQIVITPGNPIPAVMLPKGAKCRLRVIDPAGSVLGEAHLTG